jgi:two-component system phosphate regulon response regulator OmpR
MSDPDPHILVVDDDTRLRDLLHRYLTRNGYRVTTAPDAADARTKLAGLDFDLIVLDVMLPGENGFDLTRHLRRDNDVPVLLLTAMTTSENRIEGLETGADDYLPKPFEPKELLLRIRAILRRRGPVAEPPQTLRLGAFEVDVARGELSRDGKPVHLTTAELTLLRLFASRPGATVSREELLPETGANSLRAVDVQVTRLRRKIEPDPKNPRYLQTVWGRGYVLWPN